jgi:hypothetical protein
MNVLTELANTFNSDKGNAYKCAHNYTNTYDALFNKLIDEKITMMEIGLNRDNSQYVPSLNMWNSYFKRVDIYGVDIVSDFKKFERDNIHILVGDQADSRTFASIKDIEFDIIIDDGSHAQNHQQASLNILWNNVKPGGYYIIEDLHWQPEFADHSCIKTDQLFLNALKGNFIDTPYISSNTLKTVIDNSTIAFYKSESRNWSDRNLETALLCIQKH